MTDKTEDIYEAWGVFFVTHALAVRKIEQSIAGQVPLSLEEYDVLLTIERSLGGSVRFSQLADRVVCTRSGITRMVKRLEKRGFIARAVCNHDKRGVFATLTADGKAALRDTWRSYSREVLGVFGQAINSGEVRQLRDILEKVLLKLQEPTLFAIGAKKKGRRTAP